MVSAKVGEIGETITCLGVLSARGARPRPIIKPVKKVRLDFLKFLNFKINF